jgi:hypothetical protein
MTTPMSAERFADRFRFYKGQTQQQRGVLELHAAISSGDKGAEILDEQAPWALTYSEEPPAPAGGLDPRGSEEAGMAGPHKPAPVQPGDTYLLSSDIRFWSRTSFRCRLTWGPWRCRPGRPAAPSGSPASAHHPH